MAKSRYEYGTSPRKLEPDSRRKKESQKNRLRVLEDLPKQDIKISKKQKKKQVKMTLLVVAIFATLLTISYRNSQINEKFDQVQKLKKDLSAIQKENEQLEVSIQNSINYNTIEKLAKERLGMQKLTNKQTVYVTLPKKDYVESASEEIVKQEEKNWFEQLINKILNK